jgi:hypothetical protein
MVPRVSRQLASEKQPVLRVPRRKLTWTTQVKHLQSAVVVWRPWENCTATRTLMTRGPQSKTQTAKTMVNSAKCEEEFSSRMVLGLLREETMLEL